MTAPVVLKKPLKIYRGDTLARTYTVGLLDEATEVVTGIDLTAFGDTWSAQLRTKEDSDDKVDLVVDTSQINIGKITLRLTSDASHNVPAKGGVFDVQVADTTVSPHVVRTIIKGDFELIKDVTRP